MAKKLLKEQLGFCLVVLLLLTATPAEAANIFQTITERAATALTSIKQLVFVLAGFGIIAFAFAAIFGKLSWKHFANIAIGLFLVASMGLFIQYFVTKDGENYKLAYGNYLGSAFGDTAGTAGSEFGGADPDTPLSLGGSGENQDNSGTSTENGNVKFDPVTGLPSLGGDGSGGISNDGALSPAGTEGNGPASNNGTSSGGGSEDTDEKRGIQGFFSDVKNIANAAQKAKNAVDAGINLVDNTSALYDNVSNSVKNNGTGVKGILNSVSDVSGGLKDFKQNVASTVNTVGSKVIETANSIQDVGKTEAEQAENRMIRNEGGETNRVAAWLNRQGQGGAAANEVNDRVSDAVDPVLNNSGSAAYDIKGVVNMSDKGVSGAIGAAAGVAAGGAAIVNAVSGNRSSGGSSGESSGSDTQPVVQMQEPSATPTLDYLISDSGSANAEGVTSDSGSSNTDKWSEDNENVQKGSLLIDGQKWDYNMETGEIHNPATGETKSREEYYEAVAQHRVQDAAAVERSNAEFECLAKSSQGYVWNGYQCLSPSQVTAQKQKEEKIQNEKNKKCPEGQRWVDDVSGMSGRAGWCVDTAETQKKKQEEAAQKKQEEQNRLKNNPDIAKQIAELERQSEEATDACWDQYLSLEERCLSMQDGPAYNDCRDEMWAKQEECNNMPSKYRSQIAALKEK